MMVETITDHTEEDILTMSALKLNMAFDSYVAGHQKPGDHWMAVIRAGVSGYTYIGPDYADEAIFALYAESKLTEDEQQDWAEAMDDVLSAAIPHREVENFDRYRVDAEHRCRAIILHKRRAADG